MLVTSATLRSCRSIWKSWLPCGRIWLAVVVSEPNPLLNKSGRRGGRVLPLMALPLTYAVSSPDWPWQYNKGLGLGDIVPEAAGSDAAECEHHIHTGQCLLGVDCSQLSWIAVSERGDRKG